MKIPVSLCLATCLVIGLCRACGEDRIPPLTQLRRKTPEWLTKAVFYQVYPQSFYDTNGDGIGDLPGLIAKLGYIKSLGANAIWVNPIYDSPFGDAGYDVRDYKRVAPRYGTNEDAKHLFDEAHRLGIRVVLDLVAAHTSSQHAWFKDSCGGAASQHADWYVWANGAADDSFIKSPGPRAGYYLKNFFPLQPALNYGYGNPDPSKPWEKRPDAPACKAVREAMRDVMKYWLDMGCDGFRVDMASSLIKKDDANGTAIKSLWQDYRSWMDAAYPHAVLVSEWCDPGQAIPAGFNVDFLIHFGNPAYTELMNPLTGTAKPNHSFFSVDGSGDIQRFMQNYMPMYEKTKELGFIALPTANHDFNRPRSQGREIPDLKVVFTMLLTMPGVPFIYYGDEIGMRDLPGWPAKEGAMWRGSCRSPMQWNSGTNAGFSNAPREKLYLPLDPDPNRPTVAGEETNPASLLNFTRQIIRLRQANPSLGNLGGFKPLYAEKGKYPFVYLRSGGPDRFIIAVNPSHSGQTCVLPLMKKAVPVLVSGVEVRDMELKMSPSSYGIFMMDRNASLVAGNDSENK